MQPIQSPVKKQEAWPLRELLRFHSYSDEYSAFFRFAHRYFLHFQAGSSEKQHYSGLVLVDILDLEFELGFRWIGRLAYQGLLVHPQHGHNCNQSCFGIYPEDKNCTFQFSKMD